MTVRPDLLVVVYMSVYKAGKFPTLGGVFAFFLFELGIGEKKGFLPFMSDRFVYGVGRGGGREETRLINLQLRILDR